MSHQHAQDQEMVRSVHNTARYFTETRQVAWALFVATLLWGVFAYVRTPKAKDPLIPTRVAVATCQWPGATAEKVEDLVAHKMETKIAENASVEKVESISRSGLAVVYVTLDENVGDRGKEFDDIKLKLDAINDLPSGAGPIQFIKDFGDTAALLLTVASPAMNDIELSLRAASLQRAIESMRHAAPDAHQRATFVVSFPPQINAQMLRRTMDAGSRFFASTDDVRDPRILEGPGFLGVDVSTTLTDAQLAERLMAFGRTHMRVSELHPDVWHPVVIRDPAHTEAALAAVAGDRYTYRELDIFTDTLQRSLQTVPMVSKVTRSGVLPEAVYLEYSQERLASYNMQPAALANQVQARNITMPGGVLEAQGKNVIVDPSGELSDPTEIADIIAGTSSSGAPFYMRDLLEINRSYQSPPRFLNYLYGRDANGVFHRHRAITLSVQMRPGQQIADFGDAVNAKLDEVRRALPEDLVIRRTSDQPLQVRENVALFMNSLYEAIVLVVLVALVGFWEWRSALLMAISIPVTLAMTFGFMQLLGIDIQQISIASLILALGLLVDDPVVAGDAIKRSLDDKWPPVVAAWLGPTKLATAILFATITNIGAYLPLLVMGGDVGKFIYSLPVVLTCSLVASRIVSMTFIPLIGYHLLRPSKQAPPTPEERRKRGFARYYVQVVSWCIEHRGKALAGALALLLLGGSATTGMKMAFFPQDISYLSYLDIWLPEDAPLSATRDVAALAEEVVAEVLEEFSHNNPGEHEGPLLKAVTSFLGGGAPRFWFSVNPELSQLNYAQMLIEVSDKHLTPKLIAPLQEALSARVPGARIDVRQLENGKPVGIPAQVRISGDNVDELRTLAQHVKDVFRALPITDRVRDDWGTETVTVRLQVDPTRANLAGVTNADVGTSSALAMTGRVVTTLHNGDRQIPVVARLRADERAQLADIENLYVSAQSGQKIPLKQVSTVAYHLETDKIRRRNQFRTITVACFPVPGILPSQVMKEAAPAIARIAAEAPLGYQVQVGGEQEERQKGFKQMAMVLGLSVSAIFVALVLQFKSVVKPLMVFAAIPFGVMGALVSLSAMHAPFGFMAFLGIVSLIGVIVSHIIVLFDFIEEKHAEGEPLKEALLDAGIVRLRPVLITVGATVLGLIPLAVHGGPLWEPLCYAQIGGLCVATFLTLILVPVIYAVFVYDLRWVQWSPVPDPQGPEAPHP